MLNTQAYTRLSTALPKLTAEDVIDMGPVLVKIIPELKPTLGFDQHSPHHKYDLFTHIAHEDIGRVIRILFGGSCHHFIHGLVGILQRSRGISIIFQPGCGCG